MRLTLLAFVALLALPARAGTHVPTFEPDPAYTKAPIAGLRDLVADPAVLIAQLKPSTAPPPAAAERARNTASEGLAFTNPASNWAALSINGIAVGTIGPYNTVQISGVPSGAYALTLTFASGYVRTFVVE